MNVYSYMLISIFLIFLLTSDKKKERYIKKSFWQKIDDFSEESIVKKMSIKAEKPKEFMYDEKIKILNEYMKVISYTSKINLKRLQTLNVISFFATAVLQIVLYILSILNMLIYQKRLQLLAEAMGDTVLKFPTLNAGKVWIFILINTFGYFLPYILLKINSIIYAKKIEKEALMVQAYTITMLGTEKNIKYIIEILYKKTNVFKEAFRKTLHKYSFNQEEAISELKEKSNIPPFASSVNAIEKGLLYDRNLAKRYLKDSKKLEKALKKANLNKNNKNKKIVGTILLILPLICFFTVSGYPWIIMVLKMLYNLNGL